uniref:DUF1648 domain-containing protein n=1 Tax=Agathobacter sp. TaxID=2021311 RepID=UPI004057A67F
MNRNMKLKLLMLLPLVLEVMALFFLPAEIPVHYNSAFQVDGYGSKYNVLVLGIFVIIFGLLLKWIYTKNSKTEHENIIYILSVVALLIFNVINVLLLYESMMMGISISIIGGADGPTSIFLAGSVGDGIPFLLLLYMGSI